MALLEFLKPALPAIQATESSTKEVDRLRPEVEAAAARVTDYEAKRKAAEDELGRLRAAYRVALRRMADDPDAIADLSAVTAAEQRVEALRTAEAEARKELRPLQERLQAEAHREALANDLRVAAELVQNHQRACDRIRAARTELNGAEEAQRAAWRAIQSRHWVDERTGRGALQSIGEQIQMLNGTHPSQRIPAWDRKPPAA
jgi:chromosome segregation ATPase